MTEDSKVFVSREQEFWWLAFSGKFGEEFKGNPVFMEKFLECENHKNKNMPKKTDLGREK